MNQTALTCPMCKGPADLVKAPGRGARKYQCRDKVCGYASLPTTLHAMRRQRATKDLVARRIRRANATAGWWAA